MFGLYPSTIEFAKLCYNVVVRAIIASLVWVAFTFIGLGLDRMMDYLINAVDMPEYLRSVIEPMAFGVPLVLGVAILVTSVSDIIKFIMISVKQPYELDQGDSDEQDN